jgi:DNA-binding transcriptional MerR regulator
MLERFHGITLYRVCADAAVRPLRFSRYAKGLGCSLNEIGALRTLRVQSIDPCDRMQGRTEAKIAHIEKKLETLQHMQGALSELIAACSRRGSTRECPILDSHAATGWFEHPKRGGDNG